MKKINKFFVDYVNKVSSVTTRKDKTINSVISKNQQKAFKQSLNAIAFRDYVIRDLFEISVRQSAGHFAALEKSTWNPFEGKYRLDLFSIQTDWSLGKSGDSSNVNIHRRIYKVTDGAAAITCHPVEVYKLVYEQVDVKRLTFLPDADIFDDLIVMTTGAIEAAEKLPKAIFTYKNGLTVWGENLFKVVNKIDMLVFSTKLALMQKK